MHDESLIYRVPYSHIKNMPDTKLITDYEEYKYMILILIYSIQDLRYIIYAVKSRRSGRGGCQFLPFSIYLYDSVVLIFLKTIRYVNNVY